MRITVGGVLLIGGTVAFLVAGPLKFDGLNELFPPMDEVKQSFSWMTHYIKGEPMETAPVVVDTSTVVQASHHQPEAAAPASEPTANPIEEAPAPVPAPATPAVKEAPAAAPAKSKRRSRRKQKATPQLNAGAPVSMALTRKPTKAELRKQAALDKQKDKLLGTYVSVKLKSGRDVKGIYRGKTDTQYSIELPGMGPFQYDVSNVVSITPAE